MQRDLAAAADPDDVVLHYVIKEPIEPGGAPGVTDDPKVKSNGHPAGSGSAFAVYHVEAVTQKLKMLIRGSDRATDEQRQRGRKLYSFHAPEMECIVKGKTAAPYEFRVEASIVTNNRRAPDGLFVLHARAMPHNPYDGHTLRDVIDRTDTLTGCAIERAYVDTATTYKTPAVSSSPARGPASSDSSNASCAAAPPSSPSLDT